MKTTIDISDNLFRQVKALSRRESVTIRELTEEGLVLMLQRRKQQTSRRVTPVTFKGKGLTPEFQNASWEALRDVVYSGRGS